MKKVQLSIVTLTVLFIMSCQKHGSYFSGSGDQYTDYGESNFIKTADEPISTFSIDADGASYAVMRSFIEGSSTAPPIAAIRSEEFINYFNLDYPSSNDPITVHTELSSCPWNDDHSLLRIGMKGKPVANSERLPANFVLLIDCSGSMSGDGKLPLLKEGMISFVEQIRSDDRVGIVTYAGGSEVLLEPTLGSERETIVKAIKKLKARGSTNGGAGINEAYDLAEKYFVEGGNNRIILGSDGDFNVGMSSDSELLELIKEKRESGIFLTVLGVGHGNLNDSMMEQLANNGNGNYEYLDKTAELKRIFMWEFSKFYSVAKDVKTQVIFNSEVVESYRLIGYENRGMETADFEDDSEDAGELGAGQNVTALYEIDWQNEVKHSTSELLGNLSVRYKNPGSETSSLMNFSIDQGEVDFDSSSDFQRFTASVAGFAMLLRKSEFKGTLTYEKILNWSLNADIADPYGLKNEYQVLIIKAMTF